jgi:hypothetical protein
MREFGNFSPLKMTNNIKKREIIKSCPSPQNPCMCKCHLESSNNIEMLDWCWECKMGRHKPKIQKGRIKYKLNR